MYELLTNTALWSLSRCMPHRLSGFSRRENPDTEKRARSVICRPIVLSSIVDWSFRMRRFPLFSILTASLIATLALTGCGGASTTSSGGAALPAVNSAAATQLLSSDETLQTLSFPVVGSTSLAGRVEGYKTVSYAVPVAAGQILTVELKSDSSNAYFNVHDAVDSSGAAVFNGNSGARIARLTATQDVTYVIRPFQPRATARRGEAFDYTFLVDRR